MYAEIDGATSIMSFVGCTVTDNTASKGSCAYALVVFSRVIVQRAPSSQCVSQEVEVVSTLSLKTSQT